MKTGRPSWRTTFGYYLAALSGLVTLISASFFTVKQGSFWKGAVPSHLNSIYLGIICLVFALLLAWLAFKELKQSK
jgi:hypothetical protein